MGRHKRPIETPIDDEYFRGRSPQEWARVPESVWEAWKLEAERAEALEETWRGLLPPPEALSPMLPYPLGVTEPKPRSKAIPRERWCTARHHAIWQAVKLTRRVLQWLVENDRSPHELAKRHGLRATTLTDHLVGKSIMQDEVGKRWVEVALDGLRLRNHPDPLLYYWRNKVYRWPELPMTVAGQQANLTYPINLEACLVAAMYIYDEPCSCRIATWLTSIRTLQRTGEPEIPAVIIGLTRRSIPGKPLEALDAFHPTYLAKSTRAELMARLATDPAGVVADYMAWDKPQYLTELPPGYGRTPDSPPQWARRL